MSPSQLAAYVRLKTKTNSSSFTDANMLIVANVFKDDIANKVNDANEDEFGIVIENDLEAGKRKYALDPEIMSKIKYFEATFDGVNYQRLDEMNLNTIEITTDENAITAYMQGKKPGFFIFGTEVYILSDSAIADVPNGLRMWIITFPADLADMTSTTDMSLNPSETEVGFPRVLHELLARRMIIDYKSMQEKPIPLTESELNYDRDLAIAIGLIRDKNLDRNIIATTPDNNDGQDF